MKKNRIHLKKGKQKELIDLCKKELGLNWKDLGRKLEVSPSYLRLDLRKEKNLLSESLFENLCTLSGENYSSYIIKIHKAHWGQAKGGSISKPKERKPKLLQEQYSEALAEFIGIMLGDGNIWVRQGWYYVRICGHSEDDKEYLLDHVKPLIKDLFGIQMDIYFQKDSKELFLTKGSKDLVHTLQHLGIKTGNKVENNVGIPPWILSSKQYRKACLRGLIDTDGSVTPITGRNYPYIWFCSQIPHLREDFKKLTTSLGYTTSKWNMNGTPETYIAQKKLIRKYYKEIGFNNPKHRNRYNALVV